ncbi:MarR family transcriptional regulator [Castellaniella sp.]|uniref:MarR family transcriptional regulator n=1 Tax=Castellaniella sp. TaxID=1955812 RepID=UPI003C75A4E6
MDMQFNPRPEAATAPSDAPTGISSLVGAPADQLANMLGLVFPVLAEISMTAMARHYGLRRLDFKALVCISVLEPLPTGHLVNILGVSPGSVTTILNRLEERRLIRRDRSMRDRREVSLCMEGDRGFDLVFPEHASTALQHVLAERDPKDVRCLLELLSDCLEALRGGKIA